MLLEKVKVLCGERGITVKALEKKMGMSKGALSKWRSSEPGVTKVKKVADFFGVTVDELLKESAGEQQNGA